jgi:cell division protein FtsQ
VLAALFGLALLAARETPLFAIRVVRVEGAPPAVVKDVAAALRPLVGSSLVALEGAELERRLAALPTVRAAGYDRAFPHTLRVFVRAERPAAVVRTGATSWLVSARARVLRRLQLGARRGLPRIWLAGDSGLEVGEALAAPAAHAAAAAAAALSGPLSGRIATVKSDEGAVFLVLRSGLELRLGSPRKLGLKLAVAARILARAAAPPGTGSYLDLSLPTRPVGWLNTQPEG